MTRATIRPGCDAIVYACPYCWLLNFNYILRQDWPMIETGELAVTVKCELCGRAIQIENAMWPSYQERILSGDIEAHA